MLSGDRGWIEKVVSKGKNILDNRMFYIHGTSWDTVNGNTNEYVLRLEGGILNCNQPLPSNTEVKLSFDRATAAIGLLYQKVSDVNVVQPTTLDNKVLDLVDPYIEVEYVTSPYMRNLYEGIIEKPITMRYDDCNIYMKSIIKDQTMIRLNNICGGLVPDYVFGGFITTDALNGNFDLSSSRFKNIKISNVTLSLNGMPVQGYPMSLGPGFSNSLKLYTKFMDTIGKSKKTMSGLSIESAAFDKCYYLISHKFEGEQSNEGWIGLDIKLSEALEDDMTFGMLLFTFPT